MLPMLVMSAVVNAASWADGGLTLDEFDDVVRHNDGSLVACRKGRPSGAALMQFGVSADGGALWNSVLADSKPETAVCFSIAMRSWQFPPRPADTRVQYEWRPAGRTSVKVASPSDGGLPMGRITQTQREHSNEVLECYVANRRRPENDGTFSNDVVIGPSGAVLEVTSDDPSSRLLGTNVPDCVADAVRTWRFPKSKTWTRARLEWVVAASAERVEVLRSSESPSAVGVSSSGRNAVGPLDQALERQLDTLQRCVPFSDGGVTVAVSFSVTDDGGVSSASATGNGALARCLEDEVILWALPPAEAGAVTSFARQFDFDHGVVSLKPLAAFGGLDKDVIMKVIQANQRQIRVCYEIALQEKPALAGKVAVAWVIGPDGSVPLVNVTEDTMGDPRVGECVVARIRRWVFPKPEGGGIVNVTFPWLFKVAGEP